MTDHDNTAEPTRIISSIRPPTAKQIRALECLTVDTTEEIVGVAIYALSGMFGLNRWVIEDRTADECQSVCDRLLVAPI